MAFLCWGLRGDQIQLWSFVATEKVEWPADGREEADSPISPKTWATEGSRCVEHSPGSQVLASPCGACRG